MLQEEKFEEYVNLAEDRREIKNLMGIYINSQMLFLDDDLHNCWSRREDICMALNGGWYPGRDAIGKYHDRKRENTLKKAEVLKKIFPEKLKEYETPADMYGMGIIEQKPISSPIIEVAADRKTAKGIWKSLGSYTDITQRGPIASWTSGVYAVDFIYEDSAWKIWHLQYLEDINGPVGSDLMPGSYEAYPVLEEFAELSDLKDAEPAVKCALRNMYDPKKRRAPLVRMPEPYNSFDETFSYGMEEAAL